MSAPPPGTPPPGAPPPGAPPPGTPPPTGRAGPPSPRRRLALASGALVAGLLALVVVAASAGRVSVAGAVLVAVGLVTGAAALRDRRRGRTRAPGDLHEPR